MLKDRFRAEKVFINHFGESNQLIGQLNFAKMAERSEAKSAKRSFASKYFNFFFRREASLRPFRFATLFLAKFSTLISRRSEALRQNISNFNFWREASLRAFSFVSLSHFNPGTHILGPDPGSAYFGLYLYFNAVHSLRDPVFMKLKFIEDFIFFGQKNFFDQISKVNFTEKFWCQQNSIKRASRFLLKQIWLGWFKLLETEK